MCHWWRGVAYLMPEPGTRVSHAAVALAARVGTLLVWVGEPGVRLYSLGQAGRAPTGSFIVFPARVGMMLASVIQTWRDCNLAPSSGFGFLYAACDKA